MSAHPKFERDYETKLILAARENDAAAQEALVLAHMPLIRVLGRRLYAPMSLQDELTQAGAIGLIRALHRYDVNSPARLITYAVPWIIGEMRTVLRSMDETPARSLDDEGSAEGRTLEETLGCEDINLSYVDLRLALEQLEQDERLLVYLRFFRDKTQKETAVLLGKSQSFVCKLEQRALDRLRNLLC